MLSNREINYIVYNNRSMKLVENFLPKVILEDFLELENRFKFFQSLYKQVFEFKIDESELNLNVDDVIYDISDINKLKNKILHSNHKIKDSIEYSYLKKRNIPEHIISKLATLSSNYSDNDLKHMGATLHPMLSGIFNSQIKEGIIFPLFNEKDELINIAIRRFEDGPMKYSLAVPDIDIWGLNDSDEYWICEGIFDYYALLELGLNAITVSSASWSSIQLYKLISKKPKTINIFADYDYTGLRTAAILRRFFRSYGIEVKIFISESCKDASEHVFEKGLGIDNFEETIITHEMLNEIEPLEIDKTKDYLHYLKNRVI
jgi:5S rRNA maturation endonuclease (ribonuclease M5)